MGFGCKIFRFLARKVETMIMWAKGWEDRMQGRARDGDADKFFMFGYKVRVPAANQSLIARLR